MDINYCTIEQFHFHSQKLLHNSGGLQEVSREYKHPPLLKDRMNTQLRYCDCHSLCEAV